MRLLNLIIVKTDEDDVSDLLPCLDMLAMQRNVNFKDFYVTIIELGHSSKDQRLKLPKQYPFDIDVMYSETKSLAKTYNASIHVSNAQWIMFLDYGDMLADVYSLSMILNLFPTEECDILWMQYFTEYNRPGNVFVHCEKEQDEHMNAKMFRKKFLIDHNIRFDESLTYNEGQVFLETAKCATDYTRYLKITTRFFPYVRIIKKIPELSEQDIILRRHNTNMAIVRNAKLQTTGLLYMQNVMNAICMDYFFLHMKHYPGVTEIIHRDVVKLCNENKQIVSSAKPEDIEVFLDSTGNFVMNMIQHAHLDYGYEMLLDIERETFEEWLAGGCKAHDIESGIFQAPHRSPAIHETDGGRVAVYCGTRNVYDSMETSAKSLMFHTPMDRIYFLIEDDKFPRPLPDNIICINVSKQKHFPKNGKNYKSAWTYMCLMRAAFTKILPKEHKVLSLDVDVIINKDISELWDIDLSDYYIAGVPETEKTEKNETPYVNFGVIMMNLDMLRSTGMDDNIIKSLNNSKWGCPEQDAFNHFCIGKIYPLPTMYNVTRAGSLTGESSVEKISHYAGIKYYKHFNPFLQYSRLSWEEVMAGDKHE